MAQSAVCDAQAATAAVNEGIGKIEKASSSDELKAIKTQYAGTESAMTQASKAIGSLPADQKKEAGKLMGKLRADFGRAFGAKQQQIKAEEEQRRLEEEERRRQEEERKKKPGIASKMIKWLNELTKPEEE